MNESKDKSLPLGGGWPPSRSAFFGFFLNEIIPGYRSGNFLHFLNFRFPRTVIRHENFLHPPNTRVHFPLYLSLLPYPIMARDHEQTCCETWWKSYLSFVNIIVASTFHNVQKAPLAVHDLN